MKIEIVKSNTTFSPTVTYNVGGNNADFDTLQGALSAASSLRSGSCQININKDIYEIGLEIKNSIIPIVVKGNGHIVSAYADITDSLHTSDMPFSLLIDGVLHTPSSTSELCNPFDFYQLGDSIGEIDGASSSSICTLPCNYSKSLMNSNPSAECAFIQMFYKWLGEWMPVVGYEVDDEDNGKLKSISGVMTYCSYHHYQKHLADTRHSYRLVNFVSDEEYYFTKSQGDGYDIHIPYSYENVKCAISENVIQIDNVANLKFENVVFTGSRTDLTISSQGEANQSAAVLVSDSANIVFEQCEWTGCGNYALKTGNIERLRIVDCYIHDTLSGGISTTRSNYVTIQNTCIKNYGELWVGGIGINIKSGHDIAIVNNTIVSGYYTALSIGWQWGYFRTESSQEHSTYRIKIQRNHIHSIMKHVLSDGGGIYCLGAMPQTMILHNIIHDIYSQTGTAACGFYFDEGSQFISFTQNLVYSANILVNGHYGQCNVVEENILYYPTKIALNQAIPSPSVYVSYHNLINQSTSPAYKTGRNAAYSRDIDIIGNVFKFHPIIKYSDGNREMTYNEGISYLRLDSLFANPSHGNFTPVDKTVTLKFNRYAVQLNTKTVKNMAGFCYCLWLEDTIGITDTENPRDSLNQEYTYTYTDDSDIEVTHKYDLLNLHKQIELNFNDVHTDYLDAVTFIE